MKEEEKTGKKEVGHLNGYNVYSLWLSVSFKISV